MLDKTKQLPLKDVIKRIETAHKLGLCTPEIFHHTEKVYDATFRLEGGQLHYFADFLEDEKQRTNWFSNMKSLANDELGYSCIRLLAILTHPCQLCAEDKDAWHTRSGLCNHKK